MIKKIMIHVKSPLHLASGRADVNIDADIVHDVLGLPCFPARRLKGLLYESALEVVEMCELSGLGLVSRETVDELFSHRMSHEYPDLRLVMHDLHVAGWSTDDDFEKCEDTVEIACEWAALEGKYGDTISAEDVRDAYTSLRSQTAIDEGGVALDSSLRTVRVLDEGVIFVGDMELAGGSRVHEDALYLAAQNLTRAGGKRNRGFGEIACAIGSIAEQRERVENILAGVN